MAAHQEEGKGIVLVLSSPLPRGKRSLRNGRCQVKMGIQVQGLPKGEVSGGDTGRLAEPPHLENS